MSTNKPALQRLDDLEDKFDKLLMIMNQGFGSLEGRLAQQDEVLTSTVICVGKDQVTSKIVELRKARRDAEIAKQKEVLAKAVEVGVISKVEQIAEESLIIGKETDKDGKDTNPFVEVLYSTLLPEYQEKMLLKGVGEKLETPAKGTFEVVEIYQPAPGIDLAETTLEEEVAKKEQPEQANSEGPAATETTEAKTE